MEKGQKDKGLVMDAAAAKAKERVSQLARRKAGRRADVRH
jgi:hypothetical protein